MLAVLKVIHIACAVISISGFVLRGFWMVTESSLLQAKLTRIAPHVVDTLLLVSAIWMSVLIQQYPFVDAWLTAKLVALVVYIGLGIVALKRGKTIEIRMLAFFAAIIVFGYIVFIALTRQVW